MKTTYQFVACENLVVGNVYRDCPLSQGEDMEFKGVYTDSTAENLYIFRAFKKGRYGTLTRYECKTLGIPYQFNLIPFRHGGMYTKYFVNN